MLKDGGIISMKKLKEVLDSSVVEEHVKMGYKLISCPVCKNETFDDYFICPHCGWEYDGIEDLNIPSSVNRCETINQYRIHMQL